MSPSSDSVRVQIYGEEYSIKGDVDVEMTRKVAEYLNLKMDQIQAGVPSKERMKIAVLSAMTIAGELFESKSQCEEYQKKLADVQQKLCDLNKKIDEHEYTL